ncbi:MAG: FtsX-like permease family protein [Candidatus Moranbacteria bacterium]|jgi:putative ABC transport system permease protein|nr:FtsX-like permease family protein [Candidatus Moranbacteria bacterium]
MNIPFQENKKSESLSPEEIELSRFAHMRLSTVLLIGYRNMFSNRMRSMLTVGGVAIGIGIITLLISLGFGVQGMVIREVTKNNPSNIVDVTNKSLENFALLDRAAIGKIQNIPGVEQVETRTSVGGKFFNGESQTDVVINAVSRNYLDLARSDINQELREQVSIQPQSVLITPKLAILLGFDNPEESIGKQIEYTGVITRDMLADVEEATSEEISKTEANPLTIVGVVKDQVKDDAIYAFISLSEIRERYGNVAGQFAKVRVKEDSMIESVRLQIEQTAFVTESVVDTIADINSFFSIVRGILVVFGVIIMSISAMGMLNTLSISLLQRTKEVGILKALGTKRADIFKMFILEAFLISFLGGGIGLAFGYGAAMGINAGINMLAGRYGVSPTSFVEMPSLFVISIVVFIFFLGLITGIFPAMRASKIHALEALRYE